MTRSWSTVTWRYIVQPREWMFLKGYDIFSLAKNVDKNIGKNISKNLSRRYSQKRLDDAKISARYALKTSSKRFIKKKKTIGATDYLTGNKIVDKITKISRTLPQNNSETNTI